MRVKVLVVDDEQDMRELLRYNLAEHGYEVLTAASGLEGLNLARDLLPDAVILDLMMEGIDGYSVCEILRAQPSTRGMIVVILTALTGQIIRANGLESGADEFLTKPFNPRDLIHRLDDILRARADALAKSEPDETSIEFSN